MDLDINMIKYVIFGALIGSSIGYIGTEYIANFLFNDITTTENLEYYRKQYTIYGGCIGAIIFSIIYYISINENTKVSEIKTPSTYKQEEYYYN